MADTSFLFGGSTPSSVTSTIKDTGTTLPTWLQEYTRGLASQATAVAGEQYQPYTAPANAATYGQDSGRIAGFSPLQQQAQQRVVANQGSFQPYINGANAAQGQALQTAQGIPSSTQPYFQGAGNAQQMAMQTAQANQGNYQPYLNAASQSLPGSVGNYMSPYTDSVVNRIAQLGQRNLTENLLPQVNSTFTGAGQFGSTRNADFTNRALRDSNESILGQQASALQSGYTQAQNTALTDLQRQAQLGQLTQQLGQNESTLFNTLGNSQAELGSTLQNAGVQNSTLLNTLGLSQAQIGQLQQQLGYQDASMLDTAGAQQQQQIQRNMDLGQQDFTNQLNYPKTQLSFLSDIIRGQPVNQTSYAATTNPGSSYSSLSPLAAATQGFLGARTLTSAPTTQTR